MGSYARHQERLRVARERMAIRKKVDLGKEVLTGKLRQKRLYNFTDEPAAEVKADEPATVSQDEIDIFKFENVNIADGKNHPLDKKK